MLNLHVTEESEIEKAGLEPRGFVKVIMSSSETYSYAV